MPGNDDEEEWRWLAEQVLKTTDPATLCELVEKLNNALDKQIAKVRKPWESYRDQ